MRTLLMVGAVVAGFALSFALASGCGTAPKACSAVECQGCCDPSGTCLPGNTVADCGVHGGTCTACSGNDLCLQGLCHGSQPPLRPTCAGGLLLCDELCVDGRTDPLNCGRCGTVCPGGQVCAGSRCEILPTDCLTTGSCPSGYYCEPSDGSCQPGCSSNTDCPSTASCEQTTHTCWCPSGQHACGTLCASNESTATCGSACQPCPVPVGGTATCDGVRCGVACTAGLIACGSTCVNPSPSQCGASCTACPVPQNGTATCIDGACGVSCQAGHVPCGSACMPEGPEHCGTSCTACEGPTGSAPTCVGGSCGFECNTGFRDCGAGCSACPAGATATTCSGSACVATSCGPELALCSGLCAPYGPSSCGPACTLCPTPQNATATCTLGTCGHECKPGFARCGELCVAQSATQCGPNCINCTAPQTCVNGACANLPTLLMVTQAMMLGTTYTGCSESPPSYQGGNAAGCPASTPVGFKWTDAGGAMPAAIDIGVSPHWDCSNVSSARNVRLNGAVVGTIAPNPSGCTCYPSPTVRTINFSSVAAFVPGGLNTVTFDTPPGSAYCEAYWRHADFNGNYGVVYLTY